MSTPYVKSDAVLVKEITLKSMDGSRTFDFKGQVIEFSIYEDIQFPVIRAEFTVIDAVDVITSFPIIGEELITVSFSNPGNDLTNTYTFHIKSPKNQLIGQTGKTRSYVLHATSEEFVTSNKQYVQKYYSDTTGNIIQDILKNTLGTQKAVNIVSDLKGTFQNTITRLRPFQAIDMLRKRSRSQKYQSSAFVFFENKRGFNLTHLEYMMDNAKNNINDKIYYYDIGTSSDAKNMNSRAILSLLNVSQLNNTTKLTSGSLNMNVKKFDIMQGKTTVLNYVNSEKESGFKFASKKPLGLNTPSFEKSVGDTVAKVLLVPHSSHLPETYIADGMAATHSYVTKVAQNIFHMYVAGDVALTAGDVITVNVINPTGDTSKTQDNRLIAGNYLMAKVRHTVLNVSSGQASYNCSLELIKGFYEDIA